MQLEDFVNPDLVSLDARQQQNRTDIDIILDAASQDTYTATPGVTPENTANRGQPNGYTPLDGSAKVPNAFINLLSFSNKLTADVPLTLANTFYDGQSVNLSSGKWLVTAHITFGRTVAAVCNFTGKITDGTTDFASGEVSAPLTVFYDTLTLTALISVASTATIKVQGACTATNGVLSAAAADNPAGNNASAITAVRIGS